MRKTTTLFLLVIVIGMFLVAALLNFTDDRPKTLLHIAIDACVVVVAAFVAHYISERVTRVGERAELMTMMEEVMSHPSSRMQMELLYGGSKDLAHSGIVRVVSGINSLIAPPISASGLSTIQLFFIGLTPERFSPTNVEALKQRLRLPGSTVEILLLDPTSELVEQREATLGHKDYRELIHSDFSRLERFLNDLVAEIPDIWQRVHIRFYNVFPSCVYFRIDDRCWFTPLWNHVSAVTGPFIEIHGDASTSLVKTLSANFRHVWNLPSTRKYEVKSTVA